jgi:hypothetical protein
LHGGDYNGPTIRYSRIPTARRFCPMRLPLWQNSKTVGSFAPQRTAKQDTGHWGQVLLLAIQELGPFSGKEKSQEARPDPTTHGCWFWHFSTASPRSISFQMREGVLQVARARSDNSRSLQRRKTQELSTTPQVQELVVTVGKQYLITKKLTFRLPQRQNRISRIAGVVCDHFVGRRTLPRRAEGSVSNRTNEHTRS